MRKSMITKVTAIFIAALLAFTPVVSAGAETADYKADCPYIFVHGFMGSTVYVDPDNPDSEAAWPPSSSAIMDAVKKSLPTLIAFLFTHNYDSLNEKVIPLVNEMFSPIILGPDGEVPDNSGVRFEYPEPSSITKESQLSFVYDWRLDPIYSAGQLNDFINYVLECSGCDQVVLECHSYGGVVTSTYAKLYGTSKVRSWMFNSTAVYGETYTGELFTGQIHFDADALTTYLLSAFDYNDAEYFFNGLFRFLNVIGITDLLCNIVNRMIDGLGVQAISEGILPMFGGWLSIWSMVPDDMIDEAYDYVFNNVWKDCKEERAGLIEKVDNFNATIRPYKTETLKAIDESSNLYVISRTGYSGMFLTPSWKNQTDSTIDVKFSSFGATAAPYGETLPKKTIAETDGKYLSPGKTVDASGCMFPEQTWFIRHFTHAAGCPDLDRMIKTLLYYDGQATVDTFEEFPRFLHYNEDTNSLEIDNGVADIYYGSDAAKQKLQELFTKA